MSWLDDEIGAGGGGLVNLLETVRSIGPEIEKFMSETLPPLIEDHMPEFVNLANAGFGAAKDMFAWLNDPKNKGTLDAAISSLTGFGH